MDVEPFQFFDRTGRDFVSYNEEEIERFSARLWDEQCTLEVLWTDHIPLTVIRLRAVQRLAGGVDAFDTIIGQASDRLRESVIAGTFDTKTVERLLNRALQGRWQVNVNPRPNSRPLTFDITATRTSQSS